MSIGLLFLFIHEDTTENKEVERIFKKKQRNTHTHGLEKLGLNKDTQNITTLKKRDGYVIYKYCAAEVK